MENDAAQRPYNQVYTTELHSKYRSRPTLALQAQLAQRRQHAAPLARCCNPLATLLPVIRTAVATYCGRHTTTQAITGDIRVRRTHFHQ